MSSNADSIATSDAAVDAPSAPAVRRNARHWQSQDAGPGSPPGSRASREHSNSLSDASSGQQNEFLDEPVANGKPKTPRVHTQKLKKSGGFLLDSLFSHSHSQPRGRNSPPRRGVRSEQNGYITVDKRKAAHRRFSGDSSHRSSPLSRELLQDEPVSVSQAAQPDHGGGSQGMDPAQLVQMALSLSESRKRHVSATLPLPASTSNGARPASGAGGAHKLSPSSAHPTSHPVDGSYRNHTNQQEPDIGFDTPELGHYTFSPATLSRAEKARQYFELASEHRRLLEHLPPIGPSGLTSGSAPAVHGRDVLSRAYNPLQALRNRRLRNRERRPLPAPPDTWQDTERIKAWIDNVATVSKAPSGQPTGEQLYLPQYSGEHEAENTSRPPTAKGHHRTSTAGSVITRPQNGWTIEPSEQLADTYWTEKGNNKALIEDRRGRRICPLPSRLSADLPRQNTHIDRDEEPVEDRRSQNSVSGDDGKVRHRRRNRIPIAGRIRRHRFAHVNRSASVTSLSSEDGRLPPPLLFGNSHGGDENIGPLERHMRDMIAQDANGELSSPELVSPDHWDTHKARFPASRNSIDKKQRESKRHANGQLSVDVHKHPRSRSADGRFGSVDHGMSSMDELASDTPSSPVVPNLIPPLGLDLSPPAPHRTSTPDHKSRGHRLPIFRSRSKERNNVEHTDFAEARATAPLSPVLGGQTREQGKRASLEVPRPSPPSRHRTTDSFTSGLRRLNTASTNMTTDTSTKESKSGAGHRFFKGGRIGELVRNEGSRLGDRFRPRDRLADAKGTSDNSRNASDNDDLDTGSQRMRLNKTESLADSEASLRASLDRENHNPKYFLQNLPVFSSSAAREKRTSDAPQSAESDPITAQQRAQRELGRSPRFLRLAPPKINLPDDDSAGDARSGRMPEPQRRWGRLHGRSPSRSRHNSVVSLGAPGSIARRGDNPLPVTGLYSAAPSESKRHWSISDQAPPKQVKRVAMRDVARVRALLLSSGVKAHEIILLANSAREAPLNPLARAAKTAGQTVGSVPRRKEFVVGARMLSADLSSTTAAFDGTVARFRTERAKTLAAQLERLQRLVGDQLTTRVHETSDEADAFVVELTTSMPQDVKDVDDAVNYMFRQRRRRFRLVRRTGFKALEWMLLSIMWWLWFVVMIFKSVRRIVWAVFVFLRWLLWF